MYKEKIEKAQNYYENKEYDKAIEEYQEAFETQVRLNDLMDLGLIYLEISNFGEAKKVFDSILSFDHTFARAYYALAIIEEELNNKDEALKFYLKAVKYNPKFDDAYFHIAGIYDENDDLEMALNYYKKALFANFNNFWAHVNIGSLYERLGYNELALKHTLMAYEINPKEKKVCFNLGVIYAKLKDFNKAIKFYKEELTQKDHYQVTYLNLGLLYKDVFEDLNMAKICYLEGISRDKNDFNLWFNLACIYAILDDFEETYSCLLYAYLLEPKLDHDIDTDPELEEFRQSKYYIKLKDIIKG